MANFFIDIISRSNVVVNDKLKIFASYGRFLHLKYCCMNEAAAR